MKVIPARLCVSLLATIAFASTAIAEGFGFKAALNGAQEVPPSTSPGIGMIDLTFNNETKKLTWKGSYSGLSGPATAAHFHGPAPAGKNAEVAVPVTKFDTAFDGEATLTPSQTAELMAGQMYFNLHTAANPKGEIRGQVTKVK
jgi:hypothetical protein